MGGGGTGSSEETKYTVTINRGPDVPSDTDLGIQYWDTSIYQWVNWTEGTQLKEGTSIRGNSLNEYEFYYNGVKFPSYYSSEYFKMPAKDITIDVLVRPRSGSNYIFTDDISQKPQGWVTLTINAGESYFRKWNVERQDYDQVKEIKVYVNPLYRTNIWLKDNGSIGGIDLITPKYKEIVTDMNKKYTKDETITIEYKTVDEVEVVLHKKDGKQEIIKTKEAFFEDIENLIRSKQSTLSTDEKFVCWTTEKDDQEAIAEGKNYIKLSRGIIFANKDFYGYDEDNYYRKHYIRYRYDTPKVDLYEVVTKEHVIYYLGNYRRIRPDSTGKKILQVNHFDDIFIVKKGSNLQFKELFDSYIKDHTNEYKLFKMLSPRTGVLEEIKFESIIDNNYTLAVESQKEREDIPDRKYAYSTFYVYSQPELDYSDKDNPKLDITKMVLTKRVYDDRGRYTQELIPYQEFASKGITTEPANDVTLDYALHNGRGVKVMLGNNFAYTDPLRLQNDGFDKDKITELKIKIQPRLSYKIDKDPSETKLDLNKLVVTLTSPKKGPTTGEVVTRDVPYAKFADYGLKVSMPNDANPPVYTDVDNSKILEISDNTKKLKVYKDNTTFAETDALVVKDGVFRIENTVSIEKETDPTTKYVVGEKLDLSKLTLKFTDSNKNTNIYTYDELKGLGFKFALCGEDKKPPKTDEEIKAEFEEKINPMFESIRKKDGVYEGSFNPQTRTVTVKILNKGKSFSELKGTGLVAGLVDLYNKNHLTKMKIGSQDARDLVAIRNNSADDSKFMQNVAAIVALDMGNEINGQGSNIKTLNDFVGKELVLKLTVLNPDTNNEVTIDYTIKGEDGAPVAPKKTDEQIQKEFETAVQPMFEGIKTKAGVYEGSFDPQTKIVTVKILNKGKSFSELKGTGLVAGLVDLYNKNHLTKMKIGSQDARDLVAIRNNSADDSKFMQNVAAIVALDMGNEINGQGSNIKTLNDFVGKELVLKLTVLNPDTNNEVTIDYTIKGEDGTPEEIPDPGEGTTENDEEALTNPAGGGTGQGATDTCIPIDNVDKLELKDDEKKITVTGPSTHANNAIKTFKAEYQITVEDKVKVTYEFKSSTEGKDLPDEVKQLLPSEELVNPNSDYTAVTLNTTSVKAEGGTWTFKGWKPASITSITENTKIIGTWEFVKDEPAPKPNPNPNPNPNPDEPDRPYWPDDDYYRPYRPYRPYKPYRHDDKKVTEEPREEKPVEEKQEKTTATEIKAIVTIGSKDLEILINGISSKKTMDVAAQIKNSRTMLPLRFVAEALGFKVMWISETRTVVIYDDEFKVEIPVDTNTIIVNGVKFESDVKPQIVNNRTLLPIANIARALGLKDGTDILWNPVTRQATIIRRVYSK